MDLLNHHLVAEISLLGMGLDALGGCYLAYDLLGGRTGPLRNIARASGYFALFFAGYGLVLGLRYGLVAASGMAVLLAIELRLGKSGHRSERERRNSAFLFGFLRGLVLGLAGMTLAGTLFGVWFGLLSGIGLTTVYALGFGVRRDTDHGVRPQIDRRLVLSSLLRAAAVSAAGLVASYVTAAAGAQWVLFGLRLGLAAGTVSGLVSLFSPSLEWRIDSLPEKRLGVFGLALIFLGLVLQSVQYWAVVLDLPVS